MRIAICEDEKVIAENLADTVEDFFKSIDIECDINSFFDAETFLNCEELYDLLFLDCQLPDMNGIDLAKKMREKEDKTEIIFLTAYPDYVYESFEVSPFRYILKTENYEDIIKALKSFVATHIKKRYIGVPTSGRDNLISLDDIVYIESCGKYSIVRLSDNRYYKSTKSISDYEEEINKEYNSFCRTHRSFIVNMKYIKRVEKNLIIFENGENAVISRRKMSDFNKKNINYLKKFAK